MADLTITKLNDVYMKVQCAETYMELDLHDEFSFEVPGAEFDIRVKRGQWDGIKKLYNRKTKRLYTGLLFKLLTVADKKGWSTHIDPDLLPSSDQLEDEDLQTLVELFNPHSDGNPIDPFDYQLESVKYMLNMDRSVVLAATSAGKSLMLYMATRIYQLLDEMVDKKIFIVVPSISLVEQMYSDFADYSNFSGSKWTVSSHCQKISGKYSKNVDKQIIITTWQSMDKLPHYIYEDIGAIFVDETHTASAKTLTNILERCTTTKFRHGLTGTLDGAECLHGDSEVRMHNNSLKKIKDIVVGDLVKTLNESTGEIENKEVKYIYKNLSISKKERRFEIEFENGKVLRLTGNHKVFVRSYGWKRVDQLEEGDDIICEEEYL